LLFGIRGIGYGATNIRGRTHVNTSRHIRTYRAKAPHTMLSIPQMPAGEFFDLLAAEAVPVPRTMVPSKMDAMAKLRMMSSSNNPMPRRKDYWAAKLGSTGTDNPTFLWSAPLWWTVSGGVFDRLLGVAILVLRRAQIA
jgi:hypothetical protein